MNRVFILVSLFFVFLFTGCQLKLSESSVIHDWENEMDILTSEHDLNTLMARSSDEIADWELSREFAAMILEDIVAEGDFHVDSILWDVPIAIYDSSGMVRYYEFRIISNDSVVGALTGNAREDLGGPIAFIFPMDGYKDELNTLYDAGLLTTNDIPRIVDNDYPSYAVSPVQTMRSGNVVLGKALDPNTGENIDELAELMTVEEMLLAHPDLFPQDVKENAQQALVDYKEEIDEMWGMAKANKGNLYNFAFRGRPSSPPRQKVDASRIDKAIMYGNTINMKYKLKGNEEKAIPGSYHWCASTTAGFILDFIQANNIQTLTVWDKLNWRERRQMLEEKMKIADNGIAWPWNIGKAINHYSTYGLYLSLGVIPKRSIENNLPGVNMRMFKISNISGGWHYRNVIGYEKRGWWIFTWPFITIYDGNRVDTDDSRKGVEAYNPFYHSLSWNLR